MSEPTSFYVTGGTLPADAGSYIERQADQDLLAALLAGEFCYVLDTRQVGKSSLMVRTAARLRAQGHSVAILDLTRLGQTLTPEQWYYGLLLSLGGQVGLREELRAFWQQNKEIGPLQRWMEAIRQVLLTERSGRVVLFVDEIDNVLNLPFSTDEFFAGIRECYTRRAEDPLMQRLTFCLIGSATPDSLIRDARTTPFNIGQRIEPTDFTEEEAQPLAAGLDGGRAGSRLLRRVLYWTGGHPYLTQRLCQAVSSDPSVTSAGDVDGICTRLFFTKAARESEGNLVFVSSRVLKSGEDRASLLDLYHQVRSQRGRVKDDPASPLCAVLRLSGMVRVVEGYLRVRNRIYRRVFDREWVRANLPNAELQRQKAAYRLGLLRSALASVAIIGVIAGLAFAAREQARHADAEASKARRALAGEQEAREGLKSALAEARNQRDRANAAAGTALQAQQKTQDALQQAQAAQRAATQAAERERNTAARERNAAEGQRQQKREAQKQAQIARREAERANHLLYIANMKLVQQEWENNNVGRVLELLDETRQSTDRGFEWGYWWRLCHLDLFTLRGHRDSVGSVAFSPDGKRLLTGSDDNTAKLWDASTGREVLTLKGHSDRVTSVAFSPDGKQIVTGSGDRTAKLWDASTGQELLSLSGHNSFVSSVAYSRDGTWIATGSGDKTAKVWNCSTGQELLTLKGHNDTVTSICFSPDGKRLLTGSRDGTARVWDASTGRELLTLKESDYAVFSVSFSPDGRRIAFGSLDGTVAIRDAFTGKPLFSLDGQGASVLSICFSPDGKRILTGGGKTLSIGYRGSGSLQVVRYVGIARVWDVSSGQEMLTLKVHGNYVLSVAFSPDNRRILTGSEDHTAKLWDAFTGNDLFIHDSSVTSVSFCPDGKRILTGSADKTAKVWDTSIGQEVLALTGHRKAVTSMAMYQDARSILTGVAISQDGRRILTGSEDHTAKLWDASTGRELLTLKGHSGDVTSVCFSFDGRRILTGSEDHTAKLWDASTGRELLTLKGRRDYNYFSPLSVAFSRDGKHIATAEYDAINLWNFSTSRHLYTVKGDNNRAASVDYTDGADLSIGVTINGETGTFIPVAFFPDGRRILTGSKGDTAKVWDTSTGHEVLTLQGHNDFVTSVSVSPDCRRILTSVFPHELLCDGR